MKKLARYFDMFTGISGFRAGLDRCEIDKSSNANYCAICDLRKDEFFYPDAAKKEKKYMGITKPFIQDNYEEMKTVRTVSRSLRQPKQGGDAR